jgi:hypothetical protein
MKLRNIILFAVAAFLFASCATTMTQRKSVDDLYYNPSEKTNYSFSEELNSDYKKILENDSLKDVDTTIYGKEKKSYQSGYEKVLVDSYDEAYQKRRDAMNDPYYGINNYYNYNLYYSDDWWYASAYDPMFYNMIVMGNQVWVEPHWMTPSFRYGFRYGNYGHFYNDPFFYNHGFYSGFGMGYGYGFGYNYFGYGYYNSGLYSGYYSGIYGYGNYPYTMGRSSYQLKRKEEFNLRNNPRATLNQRESNDQFARTRKGENNAVTRKTIDQTSGERTRINRNNDERTTRSAIRRERSVDSRNANRYIRRADTRETERRASTYNRVERADSRQFNQRERENTMSRYINSSDRERSSVINHRYYTRPDNERSSNTNVRRNIIRNTSDGKSSTVRRRSTYTRPRNTESSNRGNNSSTRIHNRSSGNSNNSGSSISRTRSSSSGSSSRSSGSSSSSSGGRKRK